MPTSEQIAQAKKRIGEAALLIENWLCPRAGIDERRFQDDLLLLAVVKPVPDGELAEVVAYCAELADDREFKGIQEDADAIRTVLHALRQRQASTEPQEQHEAPAELVEVYREWSRGNLEAHREMLRSRSDDVRSLVAIEQVIREQEGQNGNDTE